jgi:glycosyltransferase involved in cell wall biosynthesis
MRERKRICIVGYGEISQNPRVVKEADALCDSGYDVVVLFAQHAEWPVALDQRILDRAKWRGHAIEIWPSGARRRILRLLLKARVAFFRKLSTLSTYAPFAELAYSRFLLEQLWLAVRARADLYIGHYPQSLPVVAWAARLTGARYSFDFEDFHLGETQADALTHRLLTVVESRYLRKACLITTSSWGIAREIARTHGLVEPITILNVFRWADRAQQLPAEAPRVGQRPLSLYWFSQIVSLDRGLQDVIRAMQCLHEPVELHIRGSASAQVKAELMAVAQRCGVAGRIRFLDPVPPDDLLGSAAEHDVGLCLEVPVTCNRDICITNKMFLYMLAGLAVVASRTRGQAEVLEISPDVGFLYESGDHHALANIIERLARNHDLLAHTKTRALVAARERWNWERESQTLLTAVNAQLQDLAAPLPISLKRQKSETFV